MTTTPLSADEVLLTTRAVRKRMDFSRPIERSVILECLRAAQQAPTGLNLQNWHFVVVTDPEVRRGLGALYKQGLNAFLEAPPEISWDDPERMAQHDRVVASILYLGEHMHRPPVLVVPCMAAPGGRLEDQVPGMQSSWWSSIAQASWSFMLAARARGLGTAWTTLHLSYEQEAAKLLGIPYDEVNQAGLIPVAYPTGNPFKPAKREPVENSVHWDSW